MTKKTRIRNSPRCQLKRAIKTSLKYNQWRMKVLQRDKFTCQACALENYRMEVHHKINFAKLLDTYEIKSINEALDCKALWSISNGVTLCHECHKLTPGYQK